ncbi:FimV family protein [Rhodoferax sp.]|uniref:type IV pilus assembly protein FimV n=1 Tax=Rhodoferax sp. TaxID=50421 RepID=UPI0027569998|nr:hypothetical protein [Rhodoferax sp.]
MLGIGLLAFALASGAATLGRMQGAALIGRPLDLSVQVQLGDAEDAASPCLEAEVFHADNRQDPSRIRVTLEPAAQPQSGLVRIVSSVPVDEPLVTVYLRAGCSQKSSRRYVLLADVVSDVIAPPAAASANRVAPTPLVRGVTGPVAEVAKRPSVAKPEVRAEQPSKDAQARIAKARAKSRLKLDMLDLTQERDPTLKASSELLSVPTDSDQRRAEAAALWRALNASPEDILRDGARVQAMDADISALKTITTRNQIGLKDLSERLRQSESERFANWLVYLLGALLLLSVLALAWLWRLRQLAQHQDWWRGSELGASASVSGMPEAADTSRPTVVSQRATLAPALTEVDIDLGAPPARPVAPAPVAAVKTVTKARAQIGPAAPTASSAASGFGVSTGMHLRDVDTLELVDIRHQAEFFMSLGQHEQAIEVLQHRLEESGESSPLVFLDLLGILHTLGRKSEYDVVRSEFSQLFTGKIPAFAEFSEHGQTLDGYPDAMRRIVALWPSARVLEFMEDCIFRNPGDESGQSFDMAAYRELLLLHAVAKRLVRVSLDGAESKSAGLMRSPFKTNTIPVPAQASRRGLSNKPVEGNTSPLAPGPNGAGEYDTGIHFDLPDRP